MTQITFNGTVISGEGNGKKYIQLEWVKQQIEEKLGFSPYLGTLNIRLTKENAEMKKLLNKTESVMIYPAKGYCLGLLFHSSIGGYPCAVVVPQIEKYPENLLEIIADSNLRQTLNVKDNDTVTVIVKV